MRTKHSPGPWTTDTDGDGKPFAIVTSTHNAEGPDDDVCEVYGGNGDDDATREANARLIASAPSMYRVLSRIAEYLQAGQDRVSLSALMHDGDDTIGQALRAAIALAEGREVTP